MYPECRHVRPSGATCNSPALANSHFCYFHARLNHRQAARHSHRTTGGRFAALPACHSSSRPEPWRASDTGGVEGPAVSIETIDCGPYPVGAPAAAISEHTALDLPAIEDAESIQLALTEILQAIAANQLDPRRGGLLLYGLQVASANAKNLHIPIDSVRTITHTEDGAPLAPQDYGLDNEDYEQCGEECEGCEACGEDEDED